MPLSTAAELLDALRQHSLLEPKQLDEAGQLLPRCPDLKSLAKELVKRGWLSVWQVNQVVNGRGASLLLDPYILLDVVGEGGMGQVYKGRSIGGSERFAALKVIQKDRLTNAQAVERFHREAKAAARLDHPHIVKVHDANEVKGVHFLAMEYVEGKDLAKVVKERGPLPINEACDFIRQAALGLQHAHEQGLVHRDIKPANLLLQQSRDREGAVKAGPLPYGRGSEGVVKILDMGIARMTSVDGDAAGTLTQEGTVVGSLDYIAPEQALSSHTVDIRADLYSLGCTFFFLLTGQVPFPGGEAAQKLLKHQLEEPTPVEQLRPEVPPGVAAIVRKLMAKKPEERYQTPAEVGEVLASGGREPPVDAAATGNRGLTPPARPDDTLDTAERWARDANPANTVAYVPPRSKRRLALLLALGVVVIGLAGGAFWYFGRPPAGVVQSAPKATAPATVAGAPARTVQVAANQLWQDTGIDVPVGQTVTLIPEGFWRKGQTLIPVTGQDKTARDRAVLPDAPLMCVLARIGDEAPVAVLKKFVLPSKRGGRLFVQANDLDLGNDSGSVKLAIDGGLRSEDRAPSPPLLPIQVADQELGPLLAKAKDPAVKPDQLRDEIFDFCVKYRGLPPAYQAGALLPKLPPLTNSIGMKLAPIPPGKFVMGSPDNESGRDPDGREGPQHEVQITRPFYMGVHEVTVGQFREFVKATGYKTDAEKRGGAYRLYPDGKWASDPNGSWQNPGFEQTDQHPVVCVSWNDAKAFCDWLTQNQAERGASAARWTYALPTEAQWEYGCRAGTTSKFPYGDKDSEVGQYAWNNANSGKKAHAVGELKPNAWGLYDMLGNAREWCQDWYDEHYYKVSPKVDPEGPSTGSTRSLRGGGWLAGVAPCRPAHRLTLVPWDRDAYDGFRVVLLPASLGRARP